MSLKIYPFSSHRHLDTIVQYPTKILTTTCREVKSFDSDLDKIVTELIKVIKEVDTPLNLFLGMAAPQIGYDKRVIALKEKYHHYKIMINPQVLERKWKLPSISSCYSLTGIYLVKRYFWYKVKYQDIKGEFHQEIVMGGRATVLNQELDHIDGKLISNVE